MIIDYQSIKYTRESTRVTTYDTGLTDWDNLDQFYRGQSLRNKVVCKTDATIFLKELFSEDIIKKYRPVLMMIAKGQLVDANQFSAVIKDFIKMDPVFANKINYLFHGCPEDRSFGSYIIENIAGIITDTEARYRTFFRGNPEVVICVSDGWLYFSFEDSLSGPFLPDKIECEVLSYAKNWKGQYRFWTE